jgi:F-type H+-transporting ATPase subunit a
MSAEGGTAGYIQHHLTNLAVCADSAKVDGVCQGFWTFHLDTLLVSGILGLVVFGLMAMLASKATAGVPSGGLQNFVEMVVGLVDQQVRDTFHGRAPWLPRWPSPFSSGCSS